LEEEKMMIITHAISTERLVHVLQSIALQQQTGRLSVEHAGEQGGEKGEIFFARGNTVFAHTERESGETAIHRMMSWKEVHYAFFEGVQAPMGMETRNQGRFVQRPGNMRPMLPIELEKTRQTPAIGMPVIPKSIRLAGVPLPLAVTPAHTNVPVSSMQVAGVEHDPQPGIYAVFRALPTATIQSVMAQLERRERVIFLLLDGRRTLQNVAQLVHRDELDVAHILVRLYKQGYIEYLGAKNVT
jgi:hypothetical protein